METTALPPPQLGRYQILQQLASGGVAEVLLARSSGLEGFSRHVVIKKIRADLAQDARFVKMFLEEARIAAALHHQNIVQVHDVGQQDGAYFFAMEYVHGEDLRKLLLAVRAKGEQVPIDHVVSIIGSTAAGLHHAHEQVGPDRVSLQLVHRDVSPPNILIGYDGGVKIVDFGLAKAALRSIKTRTGTLKGKASYMSPEQCTGRTVDRRSDTFALGIVMYELATARRLFKGDNDFLTMAAVVSGEIPRPSTHRPDLPPRLDNIIMRALERAPEARYQTADALRADLDDLAREIGLRTSNKALADYMKGVFGERPEPWEAAVAPALDVAHDFDGTRSGLVQPPAEPDRELIASAKSTAEVTEWERDEEPSKPPVRADDPGDATTISPPPFDDETETTVDPGFSGESTTTAEPVVPPVEPVVLAVPHDHPRAQSDVVYVGPPAPFSYRRYLAIVGGIVGALLLLVLLSRACGGGHATPPAPDPPARHKVSR